MIPARRPRIINYKSKLNYLSLGSYTGISNKNDGSFHYLNLVGPTRYPLHKVIYCLYRSYIGLPSSSCSQLVNLNCNFCVEVYKHHSHLEKNVGFLKQENLALHVSKS